MNGLKLNKTNTTTIKDITYKLLKDIKEYIKLDKLLKDIKEYIESDSDIVVYLDNEVLIGKFKESKSIFKDDKKIEPKYIKRMRIFNVDEELHLWRSNGELKGRYRIDSKGDDVDFVEADQVLFGTDISENGKYTTLSEERGTTIVLPGNWKSDNEKSRVAIRTRHYIEYLNGYQASYFDSRFVEFIQLPEKGGE